MKHKAKKALNKISRGLLKGIRYVNAPLYMKMYIKYLRRIGMKINGTPSWISTDVYFDGSDYSLITLGDGICISAEVMFLTHDFSRSVVYKGLNLRNINELEKQQKSNHLLSLKEIVIDDNSFIGARVTLLQGARIGKNCLIGAGSVVRGIIPDNSIAIGNPARVIKSTNIWLEAQVVNTSSQ